MIEVQEFSKEGEVETWEKYSYNIHGDMTEEVILDAQGEIEERKVYIYEDRLLIRKEYYDYKGRLFKRKEYVYEYH